MPRIPACATFSISSSGSPTCKGSLQNNRHNHPTPSLCSRPPTFELTLARRSAQGFRRWPERVGLAIVPLTRTHSQACSQMVRQATFLVILAVAAITTPAAISAQGACEAMPRGPARTDCFIARARIANEKANLAYDKARALSDAARLRATTGGMLHYRQVCRGKRAGTRACYTCCRTHGLSASRCLRNCRQP
jgi:hypothetical protein